jgi:hypothetical protein
VGKTGCNPTMTDPALKSIDYLAIGHVAKDLTPEGPVLGGTVAYASRTAHALGLKVGVITSANTDLDLSSLDNISLVCLPAEQSSTFRNHYTHFGRVQTILAVASPLKPTSVPLQWRTAPILHLGPIAAEIDPDLIQHFPNALIGLTPQGWLRRWDESGRVSMMNWELIKDHLPAVSAVVLSIEDLDWDEQAGREMAAFCKILVLTEGAEGARVFWSGKERRFPAPQVKEIDSTGAGDIFAAAFFVGLYQTQDPWGAARIANCLAAASVTRSGLASTPTADEVQNAYGLVNR